MGRCPLQETSQHSGSSHNLLAPWQVDRAAQRGISRVSAMVIAHRQGCSILGLCHKSLGTKAVSCGGWVRFPQQPQPHHLWSWEMKLHLQMGVCTAHGEHSVLPLHMPHSEGHSFTKDYLQPVRQLFETFVRSSKKPWLSGDRITSPFSSVRGVREPGLWCDGGNEGLGSAGMVLPCPDVQHGST